MASRNWGGTSKTIAFWVLVILVPVAFIQFTSARNDARVELNVSQYEQQLDAIGESGGVVGINFAVGFLREDGNNVVDTPLGEIVRHISYIAKRIGVEHVAFGSDFDGALVSDEVGGIQGFPAIVAALAEAGFDEGDIAKITHGNWLRVFGATWR